ncbi:thioredoxin-like protein [Melanomma pulvis-pyrius CBS 109.77]|uniref:Thioredoxin-like protein n=1 Tax=Melanomma pulvis-pyrius CBS 109.77 TaxID=1314802 RepID=A0A6A6X7V6_9PLEO|nr:thioredoxin-like protein [Melanomma pulvis-pyrius CBS 109.77]
MRSLFYSLLSLATIASTLAADVPAEVPAETPTDDWDEAVPDTLFNGQTVPAMKELSSVDITKEISQGNWMVEFYSPTCPHCIDFKPTWQTLYEFYYTSKPLPSKQESDEDSLNSFTRWYDFKFAKVDCIAYRDACATYKVENWPTIIQFKDGEIIERRKGGRPLGELSEWIEKILEPIRPGSRIQGGPKLPKVGASSVETGPETEGEVGEKKATEKVAASSSTATLEPTAVVKAKPTSNLGGVSVPLTAEKFQKVVTNTLDGWFIKFYAPWCPHCQTLAPNWSLMARDMRGKLNVGEVNCDIEKRLCKDAKVKGYPTILFFRGGERIEYNGLRGLGDLIDFAKTAVEVGTEVPDVDFAAFRKMEETEEVIFVYFYDHATTAEDFQALERLTLSLVGHAKMVKTKDPALAKIYKISTWPRFMVSRDGKPSYYSALAPKDMRDPRRVLTWMKSVWLPIVPELTSSNAVEIMAGKLVVLGILNRDRSDEFTSGKREIKNAALEWIDKQDQMFQLERQELRDAKQLRMEEAEDRNDQKALRASKAIRINMDEVERKPVGFAWVDGVFWERWIRQTYGVDVKDGEKVIINDESNQRYWDTTITGEPIRPSRFSILDTIAKVVSNPPKIKPKSSAGTFQHIYHVFSNFCTNHPWLSLGVAIGFLLTGSIFGRSRMRRRTFGSTGAFFQLDGKEALLGGGGLGKKD